MPRDKKGYMDTIFYAHYFLVGSAFDIDGSLFGLFFDEGIEKFYRKVD